MAFNPTYPDIDMNDFKEWKRKYFYEELKESVTPTAPE